MRQEQSEGGRGDLSKELFYAPQTYALALECGRKLMANESEEDKLVPVIHQMNTRIYNSAFCGILRTGYPFTIEKMKTATRHSSRWKSMGCSMRVRIQASQIH